jgi:hypothetical protein
VFPSIEDSHGTQLQPKDVEKAMVIKRSPPIVKLPPGGKRRSDYSQKAQKYSAG